MLPVLFSLGPIVISSFGLFLALAFLYATFLVWRLSRAWDIDEEKVLDVLVLTFLGGFILARFYFVLSHWDFFSQDLIKALLVTKYPGISFWGGFLGGWLTLFLFSSRMKLDFWEVADIASVGLLGGLILGNIGCLLGSCNVGITSSFLAVTQVGVVGKRLAVQLAEAAIFALVLYKIWPQATHFHFRGKIVSLSLIFIGLIKLLLEPLKATKGEGYPFSIVLVILGITIFYKVSKRNILIDIKKIQKFAGEFIKNKETRKAVLQKFAKSWYNFIINLNWKARNVEKALRRIHVKPTPRNIK